MIDQFPQPTPLPKQYRPADSTPRGDDHTWQDDALCAQVAPELFFPEFGMNVKQAVKICAECPVRTQCLEWALTNDERYGVLGGLIPRQRNKLRTTPRHEATHGSDAMYRKGCRKDDDCPNEYTCAQAHRDYQREWEHKQRANGKGRTWKRGAA